MSQKRKILIGDDKSVNRYVLRGIFEDDYDIIECKSGVEVMQTLESEKELPVVILLDLIMPDGDGFFVLERLKTERLQSVPVVVITANPDDEVLRKTYSYDVADYIQKPFQENVVRQRVSRVIRDYENQKNEEQVQTA